MKQMGDGLSIGEKRKILQARSPTTDAPSEGGEGQEPRKARKDPGLSISLGAEDMAPPPARAPSVQAALAQAAVAGEGENSFGWLGPQPSPQSFWQHSPVAGPNSEPSVASGWFSPPTPNQLPNFSFGAPSDMDTDSWALESPALSVWARPGSPSAMMAMMEERRNGFSGLEIVGEPILAQAMATMSPVPMVTAH